MTPPIRASRCPPGLHPWIRSRTTGTPRRKRPRSPLTSDVRRTCVTPNPIQGHSLVRSCLWARWGGSRFSGLAGRKSVTAPPHAFNEEAWSSLDRDRRHQLIHTLMVEAGGTFDRLDRRARYDDLVFNVSTLLRRRRLRIRVAHQACGRDDLDALAGHAAREGLADFLLVGSGLDDQGLRSEDHYLAADEVIELLEASSLVNDQRRTERGQGVV